MLENLNTYLFLQKELKTPNQVVALKQSKPYNNTHNKLIQNTIYEYTKNGKRCYVGAKDKGG